MRYGGNQGYGLNANRPNQPNISNSPMPGHNPPMGGNMPPGMMGQGPGPMPRMGGMGGTIRNNLGAGLKAKGIFQKDGKIMNSRGGLFNTGGGNMGFGPFGFLSNNAKPNMPRQIILEAAQPGFVANGVATISPDNVFTCIANLPAPSSVIGQGYGTYATYLVDGKGQAGFLAGILRPVGNGVYQTQFRSQVPLAHYNRVLITVENPQSLGHVPQGPVVLRNKEPLAPIRFLAPIKNAGGSVWKKVSGFVQSRRGAVGVPEAEEFLEESIEMPGQPEAPPPSIEPDETPPVNPEG